MQPKAPTRSADRVLTLAVCGIVARLANKLVEVTNMLWLETYAKTHLFYLVVIGLALFLGHLWLSEHDQRMVALATIKQQEVTVADLKTQIATAQAQAAQKVQVVKEVVQAAKTPTEVAAAIPSLTDLPLTTRPVPDSPVDVTVAAQPLLQLAGEAKTAEVQLATCQQVSDLKDKQLAAKDAEVAALKKKPRFLTRVKHVAEAVGVGVAIGVMLVK